MLELCMLWEGEYHRTLQTRFLLKLCRIQGFFFGHDIGFEDLVGEAPHCRKEHWFCKEIDLAIPILCICAWFCLLHAASISTVRQPAVGHPMVCFELDYRIDLFPQDCAEKTFAVLSVLSDDEDRDRA